MKNTAIDTKEKAAFPLKTNETQPGYGELAWLSETYGRMLEALSILLETQAAKP